MQTFPTLHYLKYDRCFVTCLKILFGSRWAQFYLFTSVLFLNMHQSHAVFLPLKHLLEYHVSVYKMLSDMYILVFLHSCLAETVSL